MNNRYYHIDFLRAVSIIGVITIHVLSFNLISWITVFFWNYLQFVVGSFIFCSGYVLISRYQDSLITTGSVIRWYKKRLSRLLIPYYIYFFIHYILTLLFPLYFTGIGFSRSPHMIIDSLLLTGGVNHNWLVLLFVQLTVLFPLIIYLKQRKMLFVLYISFALLAALLFTIFIFPYNYYRLVMWIPWSLVLLSAFYFAQKESSGFSVAFYSRLVVVSGILFFLSYGILDFFHRPLQLIDNKYPPNIYHLLYAFFGIGVILFISQLSLVSRRYFKIIFQFFSQQSYTLFFIHFIVLDFLLNIQKHYHIGSPAYVQLFMVLVFSVSICYGINALNRIWLHS